MEEKLVSLDTYVLQQDMRIRMPKLILTNLNAEKGTTLFDVFLDKEDQTIVLKKHQADFLKESAGE